VKETSRSRGSRRSLAPWRLTIFSVMAGQESAQRVKMKSATQIEPAQLCSVTVVPSWRTALKGGT